MTRNRQCAVQFNDYGGVGGSGGGAGGGFGGDNGAGGGGGGGLPTGMTINGATYVSRVMEFPSALKFAWSIREHHQPLNLFVCLRNSTRVKYIQIC